MQQAEGSLTGSMGLVSKAVGITRANEFLEAPTGEVPSNYAPPGERPAR